MVSLATALAVQKSAKRDETEALARVRQAREQLAHWNRCLDEAEVAFQEAQEVAFQADLVVFEAMEHMKNGTGIVRLT